MAQLHQTKASDDERRAMMAMLKKFEDEQAQQASDSDSDEQDEEQPSVDLTSEVSELLHGLNLDNQDDLARAWGLLTPAQQAKFSELVKSGMILQGTPTLLPWWSKTDSIGSSPVQPLIEALGEQRDEHNAHSDATTSLYMPLPAVDSDIPPLSSLLGQRTPSLELTNNVIDILMGYCFTVRLFDCDVGSVPVHQITDAMLTVSGVLRDNLSHASPAEALQVCWARVQASEHLRQSAGLAVVAMSDTARVLEFAQGTALALSHIHSLFAAALKAKPSDIGSKARQAVMNAKRKALFFQSWWQWLHGRPEAALLPALVESIRTEHKRIVEELESVRKDDTTQARARVARGTPSSTLIQELE